MSHAKPNIHHQIIHKFASLDRAYNYIPNQIDTYRFLLPGESLNIANDGRILLTHVARGCNEYNLNEFLNLFHCRYNAPKIDVAKLLALFSAILRSIDRHDISHGNCD